MTGKFNYVHGLSKEERNSIRECNYKILRYYNVNVSFARRCRDFTASKIALIIKTHNKLDCSIGLS